MIYLGGEAPDKAALQSIFDGMATIVLERRRDFRIDDREELAKVLYRPSWRTDISWSEVFSGTTEKCLLYVEKEAIKTGMCWLTTKFPDAPFVIDELEACFNHYDPDADKAEQAYREWVHAHPRNPDRSIPPPEPPPLMPRENLRERLREVLDYGLRLFVFSCCE